MNARELVKALGGRWHGSYAMTRCPVPSHGTGNGDRDPSLKIVDGDGGEIVVHCFGGCQWKDVKDALRREGLLPEQGQRPLIQPDPEGQARRRAERQAEDEKKAQIARALWRQARPVTPNDPAGLYLTSRGLPGPWPSSLRFLAEARHPSGVTVLALIAGACRWAERRPVAVQLTALTHDGRKADIQPVRWTRGVLRGAAARVGPWADGGPIILVEGVEDALAVLRAMPDATPWAALGTSNVSHIVLPPEAKVVLALDGDEAGRQSAKQAADALAARGHQIRIAQLPDGMDPLDMLAATIRRAA